MEVPDFVDPRRLLARYGLRPKRGYSQNFLVSRHAVEAIADAAGISEGARVLELGAGLGTLTAGLLRAGGDVTALEPDPDMRHVLEQELGGCGLRVLDADAARFDYSAHARDRGGELTVVGNLPYAVTGAILRTITQHRSAIERAVVMVQREVRDRLVASPGSRDYGALTVFTTAGFDVETVLQLNPGAFHPPPKVRSSVVALHPRRVPRAEETESFRGVVRAAFQARRKTLRNALAQRGGAERAERALQACGIDPAARGETLAVEQFDVLARAWASA